MKLFNTPILSYKNLDWQMITEKCWFILDLSYIINHVCKVSVNSENIVDLLSTTEVITKQGHHLVDVA